MALQYTRNQVLNYLDDAAQAMSGMIDVVRRWENLKAEYTLQGIGEIDAEALAASKYEGMPPANFLTAVSSMDAFIAAIKAVPQAAAHLGNLERVCRRF